MVKQRPVKPAAKLSLPKVKKVNKKLLSGEASLEHTTVFVDDDVWCSVYESGMGVPKGQVKKRTNEVSCSVEWQVTVWTMQPDMEVVSEMKEICLLVIILRNEVVKTLGKSLEAFVQRATRDKRAYVILEGVPSPKILTPCTSANIVSVRCSPSQAATADVLRTLTQYVAKAPYKAHAYDPKVYSEVSPGLIYHRMLSTISGLGPAAIRALTDAHPSLHSLLALYATDSISEADKRLVFQDIPLDDTRKLGPALSTAIYYAFTVGSLSPA
eukprot:TRINITY_DN9374_c0_g2_i1.p1 TRINITY_DN9374_c0_g2~~TRINITY_DN9374_c0_g2_i1.p1  ORF type:complete len:290 (+),score=59.90 TRINITY_DN9374_c0_g2_i1:63-872(+)